MYNEFVIRIILNLKNDRGEVMTQQRQLILDVVKELACHPNATEVYDLARHKHSVSLATVYNSLNYLAENGYVRRVAIAGEADRFDHNTFEHYHAICDKCGKVFDVEVHGIVEDLQKEYGIKVTSFGINLHCVCKECSKKV